MDALVFSWSGSFRDDLAERRDEITHIIAHVHDDFGMEVGIVSDEAREATEGNVAGFDIDFAIGNVENIIDVMRALTQKYDKVFFVSDVQAELASVNQSGAYTIGYNADDVTADELSGIGPNYIVDTLDELEQILLMEQMGG